MGSCGTAVSGMNCPKCGAGLPAEAAYCPVCGTPRSEIDHLVRQAERAVNKALVVGTTMLDRAAKELQPTFNKAMETLRPAVEAGGKTTNDVVVAVTPAAEATLRTAKEDADKNVAAVRPTLTKDTENTGHADHNLREQARSRSGAQRAAQAAIASNQELVIVMNTPGCLLDSMAQIVGDGGPIAEVQSHGLSVYTYVPPVGFAASAGSYIALATNAIYMGNGSVIGPSTPYIIGGDPSQIQHVQNFATGLIRSLAQKNGYNVRAAVDMAENNTAYTAVEAASVGLITGLVDTYAGFLSKVGLSDLPVTDFSEPLYDRFLSFLSDPTVDGLFI